MPLRSVRLLLGAIDSPDEGVAYPLAGGTAFRYIGPLDDFGWASRQGAVFWQVWLWNKVPGLAIGAWRSLASAPALGAGSRRFESSRPDLSSTTDDLLHFLGESPVRSSAWRRSFLFPDEADTSNSRVRWKRTSPRRTVRSARKNRGLSPAAAQMPNLAASVSFPLDGIAQRLHRPRKPCRSPEGCSIRITPSTKAAENMFRGISLSFLHGPR